VQVATWVFSRPDGAVPGFPAVPFYWMVITVGTADGELYRPWNAINYNRLDLETDWEHVKYLLEETLLQPGCGHDAHRTCVDRDLAGVRRVRRLCAVAAELSFAGSSAPGIFITYLVPRRAVHSAGPSSSATIGWVTRRVADSDLPTFLIPFCTWLMMGYFKAVPKELEECARIDGASRWQACSTSSSGGDPGDSLAGTASPREEASASG